MIVELLLNYQLKEVWYDAEFIPDKEDFINFADGTIAIVLRRRWIHQHLIRINTSNISTIPNLINTIPNGEQIA